MCSHIVAWQEGAALSAMRAVQQVADQVKAARLASQGRRWIVGIRLYEEIGMRGIKASGW